MPPFIVSDEFFQSIRITAEVEAASFYHMDLKGLNIVRQAREGLILRPLFNHVLHVQTCQKVIDVFQTKNVINWAYSTHERTMLINFTMLYASNFPFINSMLFLQAIKSPVIVS